MHAYTQDLWSPLGFIDELAGRHGEAPKDAPLYLDVPDQRRLTAYRFLSALATNTRRNWLPDSEQEAWFTTGPDGLLAPARASAQSYREYGDAAALVDAARALVLGDTQELAVEGDDPVATFMRDWWKREKLDQKLIEGETNTTKLGDGVYVLAPSSRARRPKLRVYDPGFYFPDTEAVVPEWDDEDFPPVVHLAWEHTDADGVLWVRRTTWQMSKLAAPVAAKWDASSGSSGRAWTCMYRVVDYRRDRWKDRATIYAAEPSRVAVTVTEWQDLGVDFVPVVHVPNTPGEFGESILSRVAQILDDIANNDTDTAQTAQTSVAPTWVTSGGPAGGLDGRPGTELGLPEGASAGWSDTSKNLDAMLKYRAALGKLLAQNSRLSEVLLGRVAPNEVPSGYALELGFHPARQLMRDMRAVRSEKFPLLVKFAARLAQASGWLAAGPTPDVDVVLGSSLPSDRSTAVDTVKALLPAHAISVRTAVTILVDAGFPIDDVGREIRRIRSEDAEGAEKLVQATGSLAAASAILGVNTILATDGAAVIPDDVETGDTGAA